MKSNNIVKIIFRLILCIIILPWFSSCQSNKTSNSKSLTQYSGNQERLPESALTEKSLYHLDMQSVIDQTKNVFLSDLANSIKYVPLETTQEFMIGEKTAKVKAAAEFIFISEHGKPIGVFDLEGNYERTIGTIGKGPGEYNFDYAFWPDETTRKVYITNTNVKGISSFSFEGEFLGNIIPEVHSMSFIPLGNNHFISWTWMQQTMNEKFFRIFFHDHKGKIYSRVFEPAREYDFSGSISMLSPNFTNSPAGVLLNLWEEDTIFRANPDGNIEPALCWELGVFKMPESIKNNRRRYQNEKQKYIRDLNACESTENWYIKYHHKMDPELAVLNKSTNDFYIVANQDTAQKGVYNDIDGGPSFWPFWYSGQGKRFYRLVQAIDLIDGSIKLPKSIEIKDTEANKGYLEIVAKLNENSNPVLMIVEMK